MTLRCDWSVTSQDYANKTSTVQLKWIAVKYDSRQTWKQTTPWSRTLDGTTTSGTLFFDIRNVANNTDYVFLTQNVTIAHNANGTKTASISGTVNLSGTSAGTGSFSGSIALPTIATTPPQNVAVAVTDVGTVPAGVSDYVGDYTKFKLTASGSAVSPATIASYSFYDGSTLLYSGTSSTYTYPSANSAGSYNFKVVITDSFGNSTTSSVVAKTVKSYAYPTLQTSSYRCNSGGTADPEGTYVKLTIAWTVANLTGNSGTGQVEIDGTTYSRNNNSSQVLSGFALANSYTAKYTVTDSFGNSATKTDFIPGEFVNLDLYPSASTGGMGVGMRAESGYLASSLPVKVYKGIKPNYYGTAAAISTLTLLENALMSEYANLPDYSIGYVVINPTQGFSPFGGMCTTFIINRATANYGTIVGFAYTNNAGCTIHKTSVYSGSITGWTTT